jgi:hypothetical protein
MFPTKCQFIWPSGLRWEDFLEIDQSEKRIACGGNITLNIKFDKDVACQIMHKRCNLVANVSTNMTAKASIEISDNFSWT